MSFDIRPIKKNELGEFNRIVQTVFAAGPNMNVTMPSEWTLCGFDDGTMTSSFGYWPLHIMLNGADVPVAGVTMVGTLPVHRRKGYLRKIMTRFFHIEYEQKRYTLAALFPSRTAIYQRYGYGMVTGNRRYSIEPRDIELLHLPEANGEMREAGDGESDLLLDLYHRFIAGKNGFLRREGDYFSIPGVPYATYKPPELAGKLVRVVYYEDRQPAGYLVYRVDTETLPGQGPVQFLTISDLVWLSPAALHGIWTYLSRFDLVNRIYYWRVAPDDPLEHLLLEPKKLDISAPSSGLLARLIDVEKVLPVRPYAAETTLTFDVYDDLCSWNRGVWELETSPSGSTMKRTDKSPSLAIPVSTLAMLVFGRLTASEAARIGRLDVHDATVLPLWDAVMRTEYEPFCADVF